MISRHGKAQYGIGWEGWWRGTPADRWTLGYALAIGAVLVCRVPTGYLPVVLVVHGLLVALALADASSAAVRTGRAIRRRLVSVAHLDGALHRDRACQPGRRAGLRPDRAGLGSRHCSASNLRASGFARARRSGSPGSCISGTWRTTPSLSRRRSHSGSPDSGRRCSGP